MRRSLAAISRIFAVSVALMLFGQGSQAHFQMLYTPDLAPVRGQATHLVMPFSHPVHGGPNMDINKPDKLYSSLHAAVDGFKFDQQVVNVFPDMIKRSVPGYTTIISMIGNLAERYAQSSSHCYDLGCSLGAATLAMRHRILASDCTLVGIDNSAAMIDRCRQVIDADSGELDVNLICDDLQNVDQIGRAHV